MMKKLFAPGNDSFATSLALLTLRLWLGLTMLINHGVGKLQDFSHLLGSFPDLLGIGHGVSLALAVFAEVIASLLLVMGLMTRFAALVLTVNMAVAFFVVHKRVLSGEHNGEVAFIYLAGYVALLLAGAGRISVDKTVFGGSASAGKKPAK